MITVYAEHGASLSLGRKGENLARRIVFDFSKWQAEYGPGTVSLIAQRPGDPAPYPCAIAVDGGMAAWVLTSADTAKPGHGQCELQYRVDDVLVKSEVWRIYVIDSMGESTPDPPESYQNWVDRVLDAAKRVESASVNPPKIGDDGNWWVWDNDSEAYQDTGTAATGTDGKQGEQGPPGEKGDTFSFDDLTEEQRASLKGADYAQNDPAGPGYIENRPCFFTGNFSEEPVMENKTVPVGLQPDTYSGALMTAGETYRMTINGVSVELTAFEEEMDGMAGVMIGDSYTGLLSGQAPLYGYILGMATKNGNHYVSLVPTDGIGAMLMDAFGLSEDSLASGTVPVTLAHLVPEVVKLDKRLLPDDMPGDIVRINLDDYGLTFESQNASVPQEFVDIIREALEKKKPLYLTGQNGGITGSVLFSTLYEFLGFYFSTTTAFLEFGIGSMLFLGAMAVSPSSLAVTFFGTQLDPDDLRPGVTYTPHVSDDGTLFWTNDGGLDNPDPVNIKGKSGADGRDGMDGFSGADGVSPTIEVSRGANKTILVITDVNGAMEADIPDGQTGPAGADGKDGKDGAPGKDNLPNVVTLDGAAQSFALDNNVEYRCADALTSLTVTGFGAPETGKAALYSIQFTAGEGIAVTMPETVIWAVAEPVWTAGSTYWITWTALGDKYLAVWVEVPANG